MSYYLATPEPSPRLFSMAALQPLAGATESAMPAASAPCPGARRRNCGCGCGSRCGGRGLGDSSQLMSVIGGGQPDIPPTFPNLTLTPTPTPPSISLPGDLGSTLSSTGGSSSTLSQLLSAAPSLASSAITLANQAGAPSAAAPAASTSFLSGSTFGINNGELLGITVAAFVGLALLRRK